MAFSDACGELVKLIIRSESTGIDQDKTDVVSQIDFNQKKLNEYCKAHNITPFPDKSVDA